MNRKGKNLSLSCYRPDYCHKYIPRYTLDTFKEEMKHTDNSLM